jgi:hypothetical protein
MGHALIIILGSVAAIIALFVSKPENLRVAYLCAGLISLIGTWQAVEAYADRQRLAVAEQYAARDLEEAAYRYVRELGHMIHASSDGWLPQNADEFFSTRSAGFILGNLNLHAVPHRFPRKKWMVWFSDAGDEFHNELVQAATLAPSAFSADQLQLIHDLQRSAIIRSFPSAVKLFSHSDGVMKLGPILLGAGYELIGEELKKLHMLIDSLKRMKDRRPAKSIDWEILDLMNHKTWKNYQVGNDRVVVF